MCLFTFLGASSLRVRQALQIGIHLALANEELVLAEKAITRLDSAPEEDAENLEYSAGSYLVTGPSKADSDAESDLIELRTKELIPTFLELAMRGKWAISQLAFIVEGGFGRVYKALHPTEGLLAIKTLSAPLQGKSLPRWKTEVERELFYLINFPHAHIVKHFEFFWASQLSKRTPNHLFIKMELLEGGNLAEALFRIKKPLEEPVLRRLAKQITSALAFLHQRRVVHHDIKPANIMMANRGWKKDPSILTSGTWKLIDFGLCRRYADGQSDESSYHGRTVVFASPEKEALGKYNPYLADAYAWGVTLFNALAGAKYFVKYMKANDVDYTDVDIKHLEAQYFSDASRPLRPLQMETIVRQMLKTEEERLSIGALHLQLQSMD